MAEKPMFGEVATTTGGRDITRGYVDALALLTPQDSVLRARGGNLAIYEEVLRDDQVQSTFQQRRTAVTSREWEVIPGGEGARDRAAADHLAEVLGHIRFDPVTDRMLYGIFFGHAVAECLWARDGRLITLDRVAVRDRRRFAFTPKGELRLITTKNLAGEALPDRKFWTFHTGATHDDEPYGLGLGHWLYWPVYFKRHGLKFWLTFLDKYGMPTAKGTYPGSATPDEKDKLLGALSAIQTDSGIIVPDGMQIELIEAARSGAVDYGAMYDRMDLAISKVVLSQTMTTDNGSSLSQAGVHNEVKEDVVKADADLVCESFNRTVARWLTDWNFPGAAYPKVWRKLEDEEDLGSLAERDLKLFQVGYRPTAGRVEQVYGPGYEPVAAPSPGAMPEDAAPGGPRFAEATGGPDTAEAFGDRALAEAAPHMDALVDPVRRLVETAADWDELKDGLERLAGTADLAAFAEMIQRALVAAELAGRYELSERIAENGL